LEAIRDVRVVASTLKTRRDPPNLFAVAEKAIRSRLEALLKNERPTRAGEDTEALHDMRVASRRLREALRIYADLYPKKRLRQAVRDVRRVTRILGLVREVDVNIGQLNSWQERLGEAYAFSIEYVLAIEHERQRRLRKKMLAQLDDLDMSELRADLSKLLQHPRGNPEAQGEEAEVESTPSYVLFARRHIEEGLESVHTCLERVSSKPTLHHFHQLRIQTKKFRYSIELLSRALDSHRAIRILKQLKVLQDELGALHDCSVLHSALRALRVPLRQNQLTHLERQLLRLMRVLAMEQKPLRNKIDIHFRHLSQRRFFERIPGALKEDRPPAEMSSQTTPSTAGEGPV